MNVCVRPSRCSKQPGIAALFTKPKNAGRRSRGISGNCSTSSKSTSSSSPLGVSPREELLSAIQGTSRGEQASASKRKDILRKIEALEGANGFGVDERRKGLQGNWVLLYQAPIKDEEEMTDYERRSVTVEGPFLSFFKPITKDLIRTMANVQKIYVDEERIENIAEFKVAGKWRGKLVIDGRVILGNNNVETETETEAEAEAVKAYVTFSSFSLSWEDKKRVTLPVSKLFEWSGKEPPKGWLQTTYMDDKIRVGRGDKGSVFVAKRMD